MIPLFACIEYYGRKIFVEIKEKHVIMIDNSDKGHTFSKKDVQYHKTK